MRRLKTRPGSLVGRLWGTDAPLTAVGLLMLGLLGVALVGIWADPRTITGVPAWLKPAKFAASIAIYTLTLAWVFTYLPAWTRTRRIVSRTTAVVLVLEWAIIAAQAWRGTTSHFNYGTALDATLFTIMGAAIVLQTCVAIAVAIASWRQVFDDPAIGWALRLGMTITLIGAFSGGLMIRPTTTQLEEARAGQRMAIIGAHTVGAPDGGPGVPGTGWSVEHGDLRVAHFLGLHALQSLALLALLLRRWRRADRVSGRLMVVGGSSYALLFALFLWQALRGQSVLHPDVTTAGALLLWATATAGAAWIAAARPRSAGAYAMTS
ncbi:MAG TPA: hypothetical protein VIX63_16720 [Vicinamibacterales bacterium]